MVPPPFSAAAAMALLIAGVSMVVPSPLAPKRRTLKKGISLSDLAPLSAPADDRLKAPTAAADAAPVAANFRNSLLCARPSLSLPMDSRLLEILATRVIHCCIFGQDAAISDEKWLRAS